MRIRGRLTDTKPAGLYVHGDTEPLDAHDMVVDLVVGFPTLEIESVEVVLDTHPDVMCPSIEPAFQQMVGLSIARGFGRKLTELFGGPRGCTHVVALLRAMAPTAIQSIYSMELADPDRDPVEAWTRARSEARNDGAASTFVKNSCHVWADGGEKMRAAEAGEWTEVPIWIKNRLDELGRADELTDWP